jgi:hypothetical protein
VVLRNVSVRASPSRSKVRHKISENYLRANCPDDRDTFSFFDFKASRLFGYLQAKSQPKIGILNARNPQGRCFPFLLAEWSRQIAQASKGKCAGLGGERNPFGLF